MKITSRRSFIKFGTFTTAIGAISGLGASPKTAFADNKHKNLQINVCCDARTFSFIDPKGSQAPGNGATFVVQGIIYPGNYFATNGETAGFVPGSLAGTFEPQDPQLVLGTWYCRGWFINDGIAAQTGPFVLTTQIYDLDVTTPGKATLESDGIELIDQNKPWNRSVTGGTGRYKSASGEVTQTTVGANATSLFNFTFDFNLAD